VEGAWSRRQNSSARWWTHVGSGLRARSAGHPGPCAVGSALWKSHEDSSNAIIDKSAELGRICDRSVLCRRPAVTIGAGTVLDSHVHIDRWTVIGEGNHFFSFNSAGTARRSEIQGRKPGSG